MDNRLRKLSTKRPQKLRTQDLPELARALVAVIRKRGTIGSGHTLGLSYVRILTDSEQEFVILEEDWSLIDPFVKSGAWIPYVTPAAACFGFLDPTVKFRESVLDQADKQLYLKILGDLQLTFTESYPTQDI